MIAAWDSAATQSIDIVAICRLSGDSLQTWADEATETNWLKDHVPQDGPSSQVTSFPNSSELHFSKSTSEILHFGHQLLESFFAKRATIEGSQRPPMFTHHSLGGGVFKQAGRPRRFFMCS